MKRVPTTQPAVTCSCAFRMRVVAAVALAIVAISAQVLAATPASKGRGPIVFVLDRSSSMQQDERMRHTKEAAKLGAMLIDGPLTVISFSDAPTVSPTFQLPDQRREAMAWIDQIEPDGNTQYLAALRAVPRDAAAVVFLSDGEPTDSADAVIEHLGHVTYLLETVAMVTTSDAEAILARMAAVTGAGFHRVKEASAVVAAFLRSLEAIRFFRRFDAGDSITLDDVSGDVVAIGYGAIPHVAGSGPIDRHTANLPGHLIHVARTKLPQQRRVTITAGNAAGAAGGQLTLVRFDLPLAHMELKPVRAGGGQPAVRAITTFSTSDGQPIDLRGSATLTAAFEIVDPEGKVVQSAIATPSPNERALEAVLTFPAEAAQQTYVVRSRTQVMTSGGPFSADESRAVDLATLPPPPPIEGTTSVTVQGGRPGDALRGTIVIEAPGAEDLPQREFLQSVAEHPPVVIVSTPNGKKIDSRSHPVLFAFHVRPADGAKVVFDVACQMTDGGGEYGIAVCAGQVNGGKYPAAAATARCVAGNQLRLIVRADRQTTGSTVLIDQEQSLARVAIVGDSLACELARGDIDPIIFANLGPGLHARWFDGADGSIREVKLAFRKDRYCTDSVVVGHPGKLIVTVDISVEGLNLRYDAQIEVIEVAPVLELAKQKVFGRLARLPCGLLLPLEAAVTSNSSSRPTTPEELNEVLARDAISIRWAVVDSVGKTLDSDGRPASLQPWVTSIWLQHVGQQQLSVELVGRKGKILDRATWACDVGEAPLETTLKVRGNGGHWETPGPASPWHALVPRWLLVAPMCFLVVTPARSPLSNTYYLASVAVDGDAFQFHFNDEFGWYERPVGQDGEVVCLGRLRPYFASGGASSSPPDLYVMAKSRVVLPLRLRWDRLIGCASAGFLSIIVVGFVAIWAKRKRKVAWLRTHDYRLSILGDIYQSMSFAEVESPILLVLREGESEFRPAAPGPHGLAARVVARAELRPGGPPVLWALEDLHDLRKGSSRKLEPGNETVQLDQNTTLAVEPEKSL